MSSGPGIYNYPVLASASLTIKFDEKILLVPDENTKKDKEAKVVIELFTRMGYTLMSTEEYINKSIESKVGMFEQIKSQGITYNTFTSKETKKAFQEALEKYAKQGK